MREVFTDIGKCAGWVAREFIFSYLYSINSHLGLIGVVKSNSSLPVAYFLHIPATEVE